MKIVAVKFSCTTVLRLKSIEGTEILFFCLVNMETLIGFFTSEGYVFATLMDYYAFYFRL